MSGEEWFRAQALAAAARSTVNPGHVIRIATRYAYFIEHGIDPGEGMQNAVAVSTDPDLCPECGHGEDIHDESGCGQSVCRCSLINGNCTLKECRHHA